MRPSCTGVLLLAVCAGSVLAEPHWWETSLLYQIYPRSFADSDGDGNGDLRGILDRLTYLKELGVDVVWLSPIFTSPWQDLGYDISDYKDVQPVFGSIQDVKDLVDALHENGMKFLLDLVPNHTSDQHPWFLASKNRSEEFGDFYVWKDPKGWNGSDPIPPNNWASEFKGSAWKFEAGRNQFYLHHFGTYQPDLNYSNPKVIEAMKDVMRFWLDLGVDGFRVDAVPFLVEDPEFRDEPEVEGCTNEVYRKCLQHSRTENQPETYEILDNLAELLVAEYPQRYLFLEAYAPQESLMKYYNDVSAPFNFALIQNFTNSSDAMDLKKIVDIYTGNVPSGKAMNWVVGNHDNSRVASRLGEGLVDAISMVTLLLPGVGVTYQGDELGMTDTKLGEDQTVDCCGRDPERTPFQWSPERNAGFSTAEKTWLPVNPNYPLVNVETESLGGTSHLSIYKDIAKLRKDLAASTDLQTAVFGEWVFAFRRRTSSGTYYVLINLDDKSQVVKMSKEFEGISGFAKVIIPSGNSGKIKGSELATESLTLQPLSGLVLQ